MPTLAPLAAASPVIQLHVAAALTAVLAGVAAGGSAQAASVDLVVNVTSDRGVYSATDTAIYTVRVDNRGTESTSAPSTVTLTVPNTRSSLETWEQDVTCAPSGGAVCPTGFTRSNTTISAEIPSVPKNGSFSAPPLAPRKATVPTPRSTVRRDGAKPGRPPGRPPDPGISDDMRLPPSWRSRCSDRATSGGCRQAIQSIGNVIATKSLVRH